MNVTAVTAKISDVDASFTIPYLHVLIDLTTRKQDQIVRWIETHRPDDGLMAGKRHL